MYNVYCERARVSRGVQGAHFWRGFCSAGAAGGDCFVNDVHRLGLCSVRVTHRLVNFLGSGWAGRWRCACVKACACVSVHQDAEPVIRSVVAIRREMKPLLAQHLSCVSLSAILFARRLVGRSGR